MPSIDTAPPDRPAVRPSDVQPTVVRGTDGPHRPGEFHDGLLDRLGERQQRCLCVAARFRRDPVADAGLAIGAGVMVFLILLPTIVWIAVVMSRSRK
ncbi:hypothetical protein [Nonomuraea sp. NPDC049758]|uniref:hypothetical protein n=1 Tax=Nonomuraea sp. NPDC049758 TaxID=3154360 RepID=UPI003420C4A3